MCVHRAKGFQHHRMTNGSMNVEIGNPAYKIYEGEPDDDAGELLDSDFTLDPDKVHTHAQHMYTGVHSAESLKVTTYYLRGNYT